jgi:hypothetical protein
MADKTMEISGRAVTIKYKDMGDGTHAEVLALAGTPSGGTAAPVAPTLPTASSVVVMSAATNATGTGWTAFSSQACTALDIVNLTGVDIEYRRGAAGTAMRIGNGTARMVIGITNASQVDIRRVDQALTAVTVQAEAFIA